MMPAMPGGLLQKYDLNVVQPAVVRGWRQVTSVDALKTAMSWTMIEALPGVPPLSVKAGPNPYIDAGTIFKDYEEYQDLAKRSLWASKSGSHYAWMTGEANEFFKGLLRAVAEIAKTALTKPNDLLNRTQLFHLHLLYRSNRRITALFHAFEFPRGIDAIYKLNPRLYVCEQLGHAAADFGVSDSIRSYHNYVCSMDSFSSLDGTGGELERRAPGKNGYALFAEEVGGSQSAAASSVNESVEFASLNWFPNDAKSDGSLHNDHVLVNWNKPANCEYKTAL